MADADHGVLVLVLVRDAEACLHENRGRRSCRVLLPDGLGRTCPRNVKPFRYRTWRKFLSLISGRPQRKLVVAGMRSQARRWLMLSALAVFSISGLAVAFYVSGVTESAPDPAPEAQAQEPHGQPTVARTSDSNSQQARTPTARNDALTDSGPLETSVLRVAQFLDSACKGICERSRALHCARANQCKTSCLAMGAGTPCTPQFLAFYDCLTHQPLERWECDEDGLGAIRPGFCDEAQERAVRCMEAQPDR
jgi:hypothetical protein